MKIQQKWGHKPTKVGKFWFRRTRLEWGCHSPVMLLLRWAKDAGAIRSSRYLECCKDFLPCRGQQTVFMQCPCMCRYDIQAVNTGLDV